MTRRVDVLSLGAGLGLIATGAVLLLDQDGAIDLSFGLFGVVLALFFATTGIALLWRRPSEPEVPAPTVIDLGVAGDSVGDQRIWHYTGTTPEDQVVMMDWIMTTTAASDQTTPLESRVTNGVFAFGEATSDRILIQGIGQYPVSGSTVKVASTLERAIIGGTGSFAGATGTVMTTHLPDGTWQHVFSLN